MLQFIYPIQNLGVTYTHYHQSIYIYHESNSIYIHSFHIHIYNNPLSFLASLASISLAFSPFIFALPSNP